MAYCMFRLFKDATHDQSRFDRVRTEMMPKVRAIPGFLRWAGMETNDGRYGALQVYETKQGVAQAKQLFDDWRRASGVNTPSELEAVGEIGLQIAVRTDFETGHGVARLYRTPASFQDVNDAIRREGEQEIRSMPGLYRYSTALLEDGRIAVFSAYETEQATRDMTAKARELRSRPGSQLGKVLPHDPEVIAGRIGLVFTNQPEHAPA